MFRQLKPLDREEHRHLRLSANQPYHFASAEILIPVVFSEIMHIAREYPIVFPRAGQGVPAALVGVDAGVNAHVRDTGHWMGRYVPAHLRRYPFQLAEPGTPAASDGQQRFSILIDDSAPHLSQSEGERLFTDEGKSSPVMQRIEKLLLVLIQDFERTRQLVKMISDEGLLTEKPLTVRPRQGKPRQVKGFDVIDTDRLRNIEPQKLAEMMHKGALTIVYAHMMSLANLQDGWLAHTLSTGVKEEETVPDFESLFGGKDDAFRFDA